MAQLNKGQFLVGGNIGFESVKNEGDNMVNYKGTYFLFSPNIGYFIIPKFAAGLRLNMSVYKQEVQIDYKITNTNLLPFIRYYFLSQAQKFNILAEVSYISLRSKTTITNNPTNNVEKANGFNISAGPAVFLNEHVALEFLLGYTQTKVKNIGDNKTATFSTGLGLQIHLGKIKTKGKA